MSEELYSEIKCISTPATTRNLLTSPLIKHDIGELGIWSVSSAKLGYGVVYLRDHDLNTYWQSDGTQPHIIHIDFATLVPISAVAIYLEHSKDESYTPRRLIIRGGYSRLDASVLTAVLKDREVPYR